jgi:hypothetical protein
MKVLFFSGLEDKKISLYRGLGVLAELHKLDESVEIINVPNDYFNPINCLGADLAFFHRPEYAGQVNAIQVLKKMNIPVIVDYDDDFTTCPESSPYDVLMRFKENDYIKNVCDALALADKVIVSTQELLKQYQFFNKDITVIQNAFNDYLFDMATEFNADSKVVYWRGGHTHEQDLFLFKEQITKLITENEDFTFVFQGKNIPQWLKELSVIKQQKNLELRPITDVFNYFWQILETKPALFLVPLEDNQFNKSKSDIACLEAHIAGAIALTPNWEEWKWSGFQYNNPDNFYNEASLILDELRNKSSFLQAEWLEGIAYIKSERLLSKLNKDRLDVFKEVE